MWKRILSDIYESGLTDQAIADLVHDHGYDIKQHTINRVRHGIIKTVNYELGVILLELQKIHCKRRTKRRAA